MITKMKIMLRKSTKKDTKKSDGKDAGVVEEERRPVSDEVAPPFLAEAKNISSGSFKASHVDTLAPAAKAVDGLEATADDSSRRKGRKLRRCELSTHREVCEWRLEACVHHCGALVPLASHASHVQRECPAAPCPCPVPGCGCTSRQASQCGGE